MSNVIDIRTRQPIVAPSPEAEDRTCQVCRDPLCGTGVNAGCCFYTPPLRKRCSCGNALNWAELTDRAKMMLESLIKDHPGRNPKTEHERVVDIGIMARTVLDGVCFDCEGIEARRREAAFRAERRKRERAKAARRAQRA